MDPFLLVCHANLLVTLWALQVQFLLQIIINRIGLLIPDKRKVWRIKWGVAALITCINISVYCIWVPARLQISDTYIHVNEIWDRCEKGIYLIVDGILNAYFLRLVQSKLISAGMTKYKRLFNFNAFIVLISLAMDVSISRHVAGHRLTLNQVLIIAMMSLPNTFVYMQFHPVAYIVKLNIEMSMAELITKVARDTQSAGSDPYSHELSKATWNKGGAASKSASARVHSHAGHNRIMSGEYADGRARAAENGNMNWALRSNGVYTAHVQGGSQPQQNRRQLSSTNEESNPSQQRSVFDDTNESQEVDFADMLKGGSYGNADSNGEDGRIRVVKTVEVEVETSNDGLADSSSDSEESTRKLPVYKTT